MLSVVIATHNSERALLPTLAALVQGAAAGIVREVIVADAGSRDATTAIADGAGCRVLVSAQGRAASFSTLPGSMKPAVSSRRPNCADVPAPMPRYSARPRSARRCSRPWLCWGPRSAQSRMQAKDW